MYRKLLMRAKRYYGTVGAVNSDDCTSLLERDCQQELRLMTNSLTGNTSHSGRRIYFCV